MRFAIEGFLANLLQILAMS